MKRKHNEEDYGGMKLRSGKVLSKVLPITIPTPVKLELEKTIHKLESLLKDDEDFLVTVVERLLLIGKGVYSNEVDRLVREKYPSRDEDEHDSLLLYTASDLGALIFGDHPLIREELAKLPIEAEDIKQWKKVQLMLRNEIEREVIDNIFGDQTTDDLSVTVTGDLE